MNQYLVVTNNFYSASPRLMKFQIRVNDSTTNTMEIANGRGFGAMIWQQTAIERGEAVSKVHCSQ
jgi:hypothetical protein